MLLEEKRRRESMETQCFHIIAANPFTWNSANMSDALQLHGNIKSTLNEKIMKNMNLGNFFYI